MTRPRSDDDRDEPVEEVVRDTVDESHDETTRREAVEQELEDRGRSDEGADLEVTEVVEGRPGRVTDA